LCTIEDLMPKKPDHVKIVMIQDRGKDAKKCRTTSK
jgi:hypothetical protein